MSDNRSWYARKMAQQQQTPRQQPVALPPQPPQFSLPQQPTPYPAQQPNSVDGAKDAYDAAFRAGDAAGGEKTRALQHKLLVDRCPQCGGPDVMPSDGRTGSRCFGCGWNGGRISHELG